MISLQSKIFKIKGVVSKFFDLSLINDSSDTPSTFFSFFLISILSP